MSTWHINNGGDSVPFVLPLAQLWLLFPGTHQVKFLQLESDSVARITPLEQEQDPVGMRTVGYQLDITAIVFYNNYEAMRADLAAIGREKLLDVELVLKARAAQVRGAQLWITMDDSTMLVKNYWCSFSIETADMRPRLTITVQGTYSYELLDKTDPGKTFFAFT